MIPLVPITIILGGLYFLDKKKKETDAVAAAPHKPPQFSPIAIASATEELGDHRHFRADVASKLEAVLRVHALEPVTGLAGMPPQVTVYRVIPFEHGHMTAFEVVRLASASELLCLGSLALALAPIGPESLLLFGPPTALQYANARGVFSVLTLPGLQAPAVSPTEPAPAPEPEPAPDPIKTAPKNGVSKRETVATAPKTEGKAVVP